jgi:hypothetical protein
LDRESDVFVTRQRLCDHALDLGEGDPGFTQAVHEDSTPDEDTPIGIQVGIAGVDADP